MDWHSPPVNDASGNIVFLLLADVAVRLHSTRNTMLVILCIYIILFFFGENTLDEWRRNREKTGERKK